MASKSNHAQLKNKFRGVEMSLEDNRIQYNLSTENIQKMKTVSAQDKPKLIRFADFIIRVYKILFFSLVKVLRSLILVVFDPIVKEGLKTIKYAFKKLHEMKDKGEISMEGYLSKVEYNLLFEKETKTQSENEKMTTIKNYETELAQLFVEAIVSIKCKNIVSLEKTGQTLEFDLLLYELISQKLTNSKMINNVSTVNISSSFDEVKTINKVVFKLKISGEKWAKLFSFHVASVVFDKIEDLNGRVDIQHQVDPLEKSESLTFIFTHKTIDSSVKLNLSQDEDSFKKKICKERDLDV